MGRQAVLRAGDGAHCMGLGAMNPLWILVAALGLSGVFGAWGCASSGSRGVGSKDAGQDGGAGSEASVRDARVDGTLPSDATGTDGQVPCSPATCPDGCCDQSGACRPGITDEVCGTGGLACQDCSTQGAICHEQVCEAPGECNPPQTEPCGFCGTRTCGADGHWQPTCEGQGECAAGSHEDMGTCGNCGTMRRVCNEECHYGDAECVNQGVCGPGDQDESGCGDCEYRVCQGDCSWGTCQTKDEECNGLDDDCDGVCDNGFTCCKGQSGTCTTSCGSQGTHVCSNSCSWGDCQPPSETCNGQDDDCDGETDEGNRADVTQVSYATLQGYVSGCSSGGWGLYCNSAIHRYCSDENPRCHASGFGPVEHTQTDMYVVCVSDAEVVSTTYSELTAELSSCTSSTSISDACYAAIHRYCWHHGHVSGFGPVESNGENVAFTCVNSAVVLNSTYTVLSGYLSACDGSPSHRFGPECNAAINRYCHDQGYASGFGPVENSGDTVYFACVTD